MTQDDNNAKSFFMMKLRKCMEELPHTMMFMNLYPVTMTEWCKIPEIPIDVIKLQLHMLIRGIDFCH